MKKCKTCGNKRVDIWEDLKDTWKRRIYFHSSRGRDGRRGLRTRKWGVGSRADGMVPCTGVVVQGVGVVADGGVYREN